MTTNDDDILTGISARSPAALSALIRVHGAFVRERLLAKFGIRYFSEIEHAIVQAMQVMWHRPGDQQSFEGPLREWFHSVAHNVLIGRSGATQADI